jgi:hypothetical protein
MNTLKFSLTVLIGTLFLNAGAQGIFPEAIRKVNTVAELKQYPGAHNAYAYMTGRDSIADGLGGNYRYDTSSTATADDYNIVQVTGVTKGRWMRANQNTFIYTGGTVFKIGPLKIYVGATTIGSNGETTINATTDNTTNGTAIFTNIFFATGQAISNVTTPNEIVTGMTKSISANKKQVVLKFGTGNLVSILGAVTVTAAPNGVQQQFLIIGN